MFNDTLFKNTILIFIFLLSDVKVIGALKTYIIYIMKMNEKELSLVFSLLYLDN